MDRTIAIVQPMGQEIQMPVVPSAVRESSSASATRSTRSVNVATMNCFISPALPAAAGVPRAIRVCICVSATIPRRGPSPPCAVCIVKRKGHPLSVAAKELERMLLAAGMGE